LSIFFSLCQFSDRVAIIDDKDNIYTYAELNKLCDEFSKNILSSTKKLIFILCQNSIETIVAYLACLQTENVAVLIDAKINKGFLENLINTYSPDYIWSPEKIYSKTEYKFGVYRLTELSPSNNIVINPSLHLLLSTSGSTGSPKMIKLTKENLQANALSISQYLKLNEQERAITSLPLHYSYGLSVLNSHLLVGATLLLTNHSVVTKSFWEFFTVEKASSFAGVPYTYEMLRKLKFFEMDLPSIRYMTQAGGKLNPKLVQEYAKFSKESGFEFYVMYGQTEATARIAYLPPEDALIKYDCIGLAIPEGELWLNDENGNIINKPNLEGELMYSGPNVMMGYAKSRKDLKKVDNLRGVLRTGDVAYFDKYQYFYITGRLKRFLKIHGNRVNLDDIEHYLKGIGFECYCGGKDDQLFIANLWPKYSEKIKKRVIEQYGFHHSIVDVIEINDIPKNDSGKILYHELFKNYL